MAHPPNPLQITFQSVQRLEENAALALAPRRIDSFWSPAESNLDAETGRAIGYDFARLGLPLPIHAEKAITEGYASAHHSQSRYLRNRQDQREAADPVVRKLVRLRYSAWRRNRIVDASVTPAFLRVIQVNHCPITRVLLTHGTQLDTDATIDRVYNDGAYAAGNLVVLSQKANLAKANRLPDEICQIARSGQALEGLSNLEWSRMACLCEMASPSGKSNGVWPLLVIPPNGIMITKPLVLIMEFVSVLAWQMMPKRFYPMARNAFSGKKEKRFFDEFLHAYGGRHAFMVGVKGEILRQKLGDLWAEVPIWNLFAKLLKHMDGPKLTALFTLAQRAFYGEMGPLNGKDIVANSWHLETRGYALQPE